MKILLKLCLFIILLTIGGCGTYYNLSPKYDEENARVYIGNLPLGPVRYHQAKYMSPQSEERSEVQVDYFELNNDECPHFTVTQTNVFGMWFIPTSANEDAMRWHSGRCKIQKVYNINFLECSGKYKIVTDGTGDIGMRKKAHYYINTSRQKEVGYSSKTIISGLSKSCFDKIKKHFLSIQGAEVTKKNNIFLLKDQNKSDPIKINAILVLLENDNQESRYTEIVRQMINNSGYFSATTDTSKTSMLLFDLWSKGDYDGVANLATAWMESANADVLFYGRNIADDFFYLGYILRSSNDLPNASIIQMESFNFNSQGQPSPGLKMKLRYIWQILP